MALKSWAGIVSLFVVLALTTQGADPAKPQPGSNGTEYVEKTATKDGVELSVRVPRATEAGTPVRIRVVVSNFSDKQIDLGWVRSFHQFGLTVSDRSDKPVPLTRFGNQCGVQTDPSQGRGSINVSALKPKRRYSVEMNLALLFDLTAPKPTGNYRLAVIQVVNPATTSEFKLEVSDLEFTITGPSMEATESDVEPK